MMWQRKMVTLTRTRLTHSSRIGRGRKSLSRTLSSCPVRRWSCKVSVKQQTFFQMNDTSNSRILLRPDVWHPAARSPLCHRELHCLPLKCLWLRHKGNHCHYAKKITPNELFSKCFPCLLLDLPIKDHHPHNIMIIKSQHQFLILDPDPHDLDHSFHERENCENHSKRGRGLDHRGHSHLHIFHIQRGNL